MSVDRRTVEIPGLYRSRGTYSGQEAVNRLQFLFGRAISVLPFSSEQRTAHIPGPDKNLGAFSSPEGLAVMVADLLF